MVLAKNNLLFSPPVSKYCRIRANPLATLTEDERKSARVIHCMELSTAKRKLYLVAISQSRKTDDEGDTFDSFHHRLYKGINRRRLERISVVQVDVNRLDGCGESIRQFRLSVLKE